MFKLPTTSVFVSCSFKNRSSGRLLSSLARSLCNKKPSRDISVRMINRSLSYASSNVSPSTPLSERKITGNLPMYASHKDVSFEIARPSNSALSVPISKKLFSMLMFSVLPNRRGRVNRFTSPQLFSKSRIKVVLSI